MVINSTKRISSAKDTCSNFYKFVTDSYEAHCTCLCRSSILGLGSFFFLLPSNPKSFKISFSTTFLSNMSLSICWTDISSWRSSSYSAPTSNMNMTTEVWNLKKIHYFPVTVIFINTCVFTLIPLIMCMKKLGTSRWAENKCILI